MRPPARPGRARSRARGRASITAEVVLHHHQGVARIAQAQHGLGDAVHVAGCRPMLGSSSTNKRVDQRSAQRRGEVDALHLAPESVRLCRSSVVADAHIARYFRRVPISSCRSLSAWTSPVAAVFSLSKWPVTPVDRALAAIVSGIQHPRQPCTSKNRRRRSMGSSIRSCRHRPGSCSSCRRPLHALGHEAFPGSRRRRRPLRPMRQSRLSVLRRAPAQDGTACSCGTGQQHADGILRPWSPGIRRSAGCRTTAGSICRPSGASPDHPVLCSGVSRCHEVSRGMPAVSAWRIRSSWHSLSRRASGWL